MFARQNVETFQRYGVKNIVTTCPHCFNTFKNEYPDFGGQYEVIHHSQLIQELLDQGRLPLEPGRFDKVTYHDPCYLGRYNERVRRAAVVWWTRWGGAHRDGPFAGAGLLLRRGRRAVLDGRSRRGSASTWSGPGRWRPRARTRSAPRAPICMLMMEDGLTTVAAEAGGDGPVHPGLGGAGGGGFGDWWRPRATGPPAGGRRRPRAQRPADRPGPARRERWPAAGRRRAAAGGSGAGGAVDFLLNEEQRQIVAMVRELAKEKDRAPRGPLGRGGAVPRGAGGDLRRGGALGLAVPEEYGGLGARAPDPGAGHRGAVQSGRQRGAAGGGAGFGHDAHSGGRQRGAEAAAGCPSSPRANGCRPSPSPSRGRGRIPAAWSCGPGARATSTCSTARKIFISNGSIAHGVTVFARTDPDSRGPKGISAFFVEKGTPGFTAVPMKGKLGLRASDTAQLFFENCRIPAANRLGQEGEGFCHRHEDPGPLPGQYRRPGVGRGPGRL